VQVVANLRFDRRNVFVGNLMYELQFGGNQRWIMMRKA